MVGWTIVFWLDDLVWNVSFPPPPTHFNMWETRVGLEARTVQLQGFNITDWLKNMLLMQILPKS
jgi:hypothetical protein